MKTLDIEQGTSEWHAFRKQGIGSSDIAVLLGSYPFKKRTLLSLYEDKTSDLIDDQDSPAMAYGRAEEAKALDKLREKNPNLKAACAIHDDYDFIRCSFDALGRDIFYEIKSPYSLEVLEKALSGQLQDYWLDQARWELLISGFEKGYIAVWDSSNVHTFEVKRDPEWEEKAIKAASDFWYNHVIAGVRPEPTENDYIEVEDPECAQFIQQYYAACEKEKEIKKQKDAIKAQILDRGPGHDFIVEGVKIYQTQTTSYDFNRMKQDGINVDLYKKASHPYWMITPKKGALKTR